MYVKGWGTVSVMKTNVPCVSEGKCQVDKWPIMRILHRPVEYVNKAKLTSLIYNREPILKQLKPIYVFNIDVGEISTMQCYCCLTWKGKNNNKSRLSDHLWFSLRVNWQILKFKGQP